MSTSNGNVGGARATVLVAAVVLAVLASIAVHAVWPVGYRVPPAQTAVETVYDRVTSSGKIRAGYVVLPPAVIKDPNTGAMTGVFVDTLLKAGENLGLEVEFTEEVGWGTMIEGLKTNRYDVVCAQVWPNASRSVHAEFSVPLYYVPIGVYVRHGDSRFAGNLNTINSPEVKISTVDGEMADIIAKTRFPKAKTVSLPQMTDLPQMLLQVHQGRADVTFVMLHDGERYLKSNPGSIENIAAGAPIQYFPNCYMFRPGETRFKAMLNTTLEELTNRGFVSDVIDKYEVYPGTVYKVARPFLPPSGS